MRQMIRPGQLITLNNINKLIIPGTTMIGGGSTLLQNAKESIFGLIPEPEEEFIYELRSYCRVKFNESPTLLNQDLSDSVDSLESGSTTGIYYVNYNFDTLESDMIICNNESIRADGHVYTVSVNTLFTNPDKGEIRKIRIENRNVNPETGEVSQSVQADQDFFNNIYVFRKISNPNYGV